MVNLPFPCFIPQDTKARADRFTEQIRVRLSHAHRSPLLHYARSIKYKRMQSPNCPTDITAHTRVSVSPECVSKFNELKLGKSVKYIIYKLSDDYKEIVVEDSSSDPDWEAFQSKLMNAKAGHKGKEGKGPRYAVYDFQYELEGGEGTRYAVTALPVESLRGIAMLRKGIGTRSSSSHGAQMREHWSL